MKITDESLERLAAMGAVGQFEGQPKSITLPPGHAPRIARELLLLRAEVRAAREMRREMLEHQENGGLPPRCYTTYEFILSGHNEIPSELTAYDAARKATDEAGFDPF